jgi:hypothetical protein
VKLAVSIVAVVAWVGAIVGVYGWSQASHGWALANAVIVAVFGLLAIGFFLRAIWRAD